jgi:hypothetical protein
MLSLEQLKSLKARNFTFVGMAAINAAIAEAEAQQAAQGVPGADLAAQRAAIIIAENNAPALIAAENALREAERLLKVEADAQIAEIAAQDAAQDAAALNLAVPDGLPPDGLESAQDAQIIAEGEVDTDTVSDPDGMQ